MSSVNELFQNIRFLKFYGWERMKETVTTQLRNDELRWRVKANIVDTLIAFTWCAARLCA